MLMNNEESIEKKMAISTKWTTLGEISAKLIAPITNLFLARLLIPSDFGIVATITMIISFADIFSDAGFQKFLIQADIEKNEIDDFSNVAFWTNFFVSILIWTALYFSRGLIANLLNTDELVKILPIATLSIIISSLSTIQVALFRKNFLFKELFLIRVIGLLIPLIITIPLAFFGYKYWSIIIGNIVLSAVNTLCLTYYSKWKPKFYFDIKILKRMLTFSMWTLIEGISIWLTSWIDTFIISSKLNNADLGTYKTGTTNINGIMSLITGSTTPVLFSGLSKLKNDNENFLNVFFKMQRMVSIVLLPLGVGIFVFKDFAKTILLGTGWSGAATVIGHWAITSAIMIVLGNYCSEVYRAKGKPKLSFIAQICHLIFLIPIIYFSVNKGLTFLVIIRSWARLQFVLVHVIILKTYFDFPILSMFRNIVSTAFSSALMGLLGMLLLKFNSSYIFQMISIFSCIVVYILLLLCFKDTRHDINLIYKNFRKKSVK